MSTRLRITPVVLVLACGASRAPAAHQDGAAGRSSGAGTGGSANFGGAAGRSQGAAGTKASEAGQASFEAPCFDVNGVPDCSTLFPQERPLEPTTVVSATAVDADARFTMLGGWLALAELPGGRPPRVVVVGPGAATEILDVDVDSDSGELHVESVWGGAGTSIDGAMSTRAAALGCNDAGCQLLTVAATEQVLRELPGYELPSGAEVHELVGGADGLCAYGSGLFCLKNGVWTTEIEASYQVTAVTLEYPPAAVTDSGSWFVRADVGWQLQASSIGDALELASGGQTVSALAGDGTWTVTSINPSASASCVQAPSLERAFPGTGPFGEHWLVLDEQSNVFAQRTLSMPAPPHDEWCRSSSGAAGPILTASKVQCGISANILALTEGEVVSLLGQLLCAVD